MKLHQANAGIRKGIAKQIQLRMSQITIFPTLFMWGCLTNA
jgi:hypothetical protein